MSSVDFFRDLVNERLTAAAEEIFTVFKKTIIVYEEEIDRQRKLLDIVWKPEIKLHRIEVTQQRVHTDEGEKEEEEEDEVVLTDHQLFSHLKSSYPAQDPEPPKIKEEREEVCTSQRDEQLLLKQETDTFMPTPSSKESNHSGNETLCFNPLKSHGAAETELPTHTYIYVCNKSDAENSETLEPNRDFKLLPHSSLVTEGQGHERSEHGHSVIHGNTIDITFNNSAVKQHIKCDTCGKAFRYKSKLQRHLPVHTGERPYSCKTCGKRFTDPSILNTHLKIHTGEKPHCCKICRKVFRSSSGLVVHMRTHTGEKPYSCQTCGKGFKWNSCFTLHMRTHSGERPYTCTICGRDFRSSSNLKGHLGIHADKRLFHCSTEASGVVGPMRARNCVLEKHVEEVSVQ